MKKFLTIITLTAFAASSASLLAAPKKPAPATPDPAAAPAAPAKPADAKPVDAKPAAAKPAAKPIPMYTRADVIDVAAKTITTKRKDGVEVKNVLSDTAEILNDKVPAKLEDIKVGDMVSGSRIKKSETEYEVVKITKFGPKAEKKAAAPKAPALAPKKTTN